MSLGGLKTLEVLVLSKNSKATAEGIKKLKMAIPKVQVSQTED
jgi:hypothetical protein